MPANRVKASLPFPQQRADEHGQPGEQAGQLLTAVTDSPGNEGPGVPFWFSALEMGWRFLLSFNTVRG